MSLLPGLLRPSHPPPASPWRWLYPFALAVMVVVASGRTHVAAPSGVGFDKLAHFSVFGLLATLVARCPGVHRFRYAILVVSCFGIADEFRQSFTPGRSVEFADWIADTSGAVTAVVLYAFWPAYRRVLETPLRLPGRRRARAAIPIAASDAASPSASASAT
jgi:VanZ family protein